MLTPVFGLVKWTFIHIYICWGFQWSTDIFSQRIYSEVHGQFNKQFKRVQLVLCSDDTGVM